VRRVLMLAGDVNLMNVADPQVPFAQIAPLLQGADVRFCNLECCLYEPPAERSLAEEGFYALPAAGQALLAAGFQVVGTANNVNYGGAAILASLRELDRLGIAHTGSGPNREAARAPAFFEHRGMRFGFLQRTSVYWPTDHEAGERSPGVAALPGHTAYQPPLHATRPGLPPPNRPGLPPEVLTWADPACLADYRSEVAALAARAHFVVASHHWGLGREVLHYMVEIARAAIDSGADLVVGHGPHVPLAVGFHRGRPILYGLGNFCFHTGHRGRVHENWIGMLAAVTLEERAIARVAFRFVRRNERNETVPCSMAAERETLEALAERSRALGAAIAVEGEEAVCRAL
jgi:poly-gamma-glutamate synthesis protein (capsule biosynthesis protein)